MRQVSTPVSFNKTVRTDQVVNMTSGRAGVVVPLGFFPLLPGDSASGRIGLDIMLAQMPRPLHNGVTARFQAWFVPKSTDPRFASYDELLQGMAGTQIKALGVADRSPPSFFNVLSGATRTAYLGSEFFKTLGLHAANGVNMNSDLIDAFVLVYNSRLAAHSNKLTRRKYILEDASEATTLPRAFWPSSRFAQVVPDYERELVVGSLDLDVIAGRLPISGLGVTGTPGQTVASLAMRSTAFPTAENITQYLTATSSLTVETTGTGSSIVPEIYAEMGGQAANVSLADMDKARTTQAFAKLRTAYAGADYTGFDNDEALTALLMQGLKVPQEEYKRPWLLDSQTVGVGFQERFATDAANIEASTTRGRASAVLSVNIPQQDVGGVVIYTVEVLPERLDERMSDEWVYATDIDHLPNALRDVQRVEPVDTVLNRRVDAKHTSPNGVYGFEAMNGKWNRDYTRLGGRFYQATPNAAWTETRATIWQTEIVDPTFSGTHYLAPAPFPHDVFKDTVGPAFDAVARHSVTVVGLTQFGDVLAEDNDDYTAIVTAGV